MTAPPAASTRPMPARAPAPAGKAVDFRLVALIVASALFMEFLDATVLATALPTMARDFHVPAPMLSVALTAYLLALAIFVPASGALADRFGTRDVFRGAIVLFMAGSVGCSLAPGLGALVAARFVQGMGGAMMIPVGRLVLLRVVDKRDMVNAMSWLLVPALIGPVLGPPLGGLIITWADWRWIFYINLPMGVLGVWLVSRFIADIREPAPPRFDTLGFVLSGVSLGCLLFGCEMLARAGEARMAGGLLGIGLVAGLAYVAHARRHASPLLDLSLLADKTFRLSLIAGSITRITQGAQPFLLPLMMQLGFGFSPARSGTITIATAIGSLLMKGVAPKVLRRFGFRRSLIVNGLVAAGGYALCGLFAPGWPLWAIFAVLVACGFFMSFQFTAYNTIAYASIAPARMSSATAFYATFQQLMLSLGVCSGAAALHGAMVWHGHARPVLGDFALAFWCVTAVSATATVWNLRFAGDAGADMAGHTPAE